MRTIFIFSIFIVSFISCDKDCFFYERMGTFAITKIDGIDVSNQNTIEILCSDNLDPDKPCFSYIQGISSGIIGQECVGGGVFIFVFDGFEWYLQDINGREILDDGSWPEHRADWGGSGEYKPKVGDKYKVVAIFVSGTLSLEKNERGELKVARLNDLPKHERSNTIDVLIK